MKCLSPITLKNESAKLQRVYGKFRQVPCGRCPACIDNKRKSWYFRLVQEEKNSLNSYFITLTYSDEKLPRNSLGFPTFSIDDVQKFFKRLRKCFDNEMKNYQVKLPFRYFLIGEYGSKFGRPHYHALFFNVPYGVDLFRIILRTWGHGRIAVGECNNKSIGYCANYMYGKCELMPDEFVDDTNKIPLLSSRKPGIGAFYLKPSIINWHKDGLKSYSCIGDVKYALPQYYKNKIFTEEERHIIYHKNKERLILELYEEFLEDEKYLSVVGSEVPSLSTQRKQEFIRKFYQRVKKHKESKFNYEHI